MNRRSFTRNIALSTGAFALPTFSETRRKIKPARLKTGDTIGMITPGSYISDESLEKAVSNVESLGLNVKLSKNIRAKRGFTAGTDRERLDDLHAMFSDNTVAGVWCARGGYGCGRLLPNIDFNLIKKHPKVLIGYSDVTALLQGVHCKTGLICFHGPVAASNFTEYTTRHLKAVLMEGKSTYLISPSEENKIETIPAFQTQVIRSGKATGEIIGGNLSLLAALAGTNFEPHFKNKIVFIEDIGEKPYRIDRMLTQLRQANHLKHAAGIALGIFEDCEVPEDTNSLSLIETLKDRLGNLGMPVIYGLSFGHISNQFTFPIGIEATLNVEEQTVYFLESGVI